MEQTSEISACLSCGSTIFLFEAKVDWMYVRPTWTAMHFGVVDRREAEGRLESNRTLDIHFHPRDLSVDSPIMDPSHLFVYRSTRIRSIGDGWRGESCLKWPVWTAPTPVDHSNGPWETAFAPLASHWEHSTLQISHGLLLHHKVTWQKDLGLLRIVGPTLVLTSGNSTATKAG